MVIRSFIMFYNKEYSLPDYLPVAGEKIIAYITSSKTNNAMWNANSLVQEIQNIYNQQNI